MPRKSFITSMAVIVALGLATQGFTQSGRSSRPDPSKNTPEITNEEWYAAVADWTGRKTIRFYGRNGSATGRADTKDSTIRFYGKDAVRGRAAANQLGDAVRDHLPGQS